MAFVNGVVVGKSVFAGNSVNKCESLNISPVIVNRVGNRSVIVAGRKLEENTKFESIESNKAALNEAIEEADGQLQGFTPYSEMVNGRMAMIGFTLALVTEIIAPSHPSLITQLFTMFPINKIFGQ
mmetsp:Transcript_19603/g.19699  ORF Transcript_19603/g.19699 Transcript_19603/m.19699 type:complete len:126 (+) Transcript_19603:3-380(+)|eukprot:CAMPEP_0182442222 /NCGR_PEP_ID=MMETSP1172-20130603/1166_1 /TAXON_ID=708627 /ORGANISM="Timspurckia oligopyrenoides, Strain CCMP3278" /LENGTH=125 /DNA_ID=CAMNT_0024636965 /DNA_START=275 /DNA_END=652 /DNA_ORIENTATION=+